MTDTPNPVAPASVPAAQTNVEKPASAPVTSAPAFAAQPAPQPAAAPVVPVAPVVAAPVTPLAPAAPVAFAGGAQDEEKDEPAPQMDELAYLKGRATLMGIQFSNNIGVDALKAKINEKINGEKPAEPEENDEEELPPTSPAALAKPAQTLRQRLLQDNMRLIRIRISCMDPKKKDLPGEIFTVANRFIGTVRKFVPFGDATEGGYHVPYVIFKLLRKRKYLSITTKKNKNGQDEVITKYLPEFAIEELPPLTELELARLGQAQIAAGTVNPGELQ